METKKGYRIADFENALPKGAVFDEVVYQSNSGQRVKYVHGVVGDGVRVTWDFIGKCYRRRNWVRMPEWDLKMGESAQACAAPELLQVGENGKGGEI